LSFSGKRKVNRTRRASEAVVGRVVAGLYLAMIVALWLVAWIPMAIYSLLALATAPLRRAKPVFQPES